MGCEIDRRTAASPAFERNQNPESPRREALPANTLFE